jgi:prophage regulatory protein
MNNIEYWRDPKICQATKLSRSTIWRLERAGKFPARRQLSANAVGWLRSEVEAWLASRQPTKGE